MEQINKYTIKLIRYVLNGDMPTLPENIDFEALFAFSKSHGVENMVYVGLRDLKIEVPETTLKKFKDAYESSIMVEAVQTLELEAISEIFEEKNIPHIPLKGSVVKYLYPMPDYRKSGDIDILIHREDEHKIESIMKEFGYTSDEDFEGHDVHYAYKKPPFMEIEIHRRLVRESNRASDFCMKVWDNVHRKDGTEYSYLMSNEFLYVYLMAHLGKHIYSGGAGIRLISDIWIMRNKTELDMTLVKKYLKEANLVEIDKMVVGLVNRWFADTPGDENTLILEKVVMTGGSFGNAETRKLITDNDPNNKKGKNFIKMLFPSAKSMYGKYPVLKTKKYLLPFIWIHRAFFLIISKRERVSGKLKSNFSTEMKTEKLNDIMDAVSDK